MMMLLSDPVGRVPRNPAPYQPITAIKQAIRHAVTTCDLISNLVALVCLIRVKRPSLHRRPLGRFDYWRWAIQSDAVVR